MTGDMVFAERSATTSASPVKDIVTFHDPEIPAA